VSGLFVTSIRAGRLGYYFHGIARGDEDCRTALNPDEYSTYGRWSGYGSSRQQLAEIFDDLKLLARDERFIRPISNLGYDLTFVAPKQISILYGLANQDLSNKILEAHKAAVSEILDELAPNISWNSPGQVSAIGFAHRTSRLLDPHLHTHLIVANRVDTSSNQLRALNSPALYHLAGDASVQYRVLLAKEILQRIGILMIESDIDKLRGPTLIPGFNQEIVDLFSKRGVQVKELTSDWGNHSMGASRAAALATRPSKVLVDDISLHQKWQQELTNAGFGLDLMKGLAHKSPKLGLSCSITTDRPERRRDYLAEFISRLKHPSKFQGWVRLVPYRDDLYDRQRVFNLGEVVSVIYANRELLRPADAESRRRAAFANQCEIVVLSGFDVGKIAEVSSRYLHQNLVIAVKDSIKELPLPGMVLSVDERESHFESLDRENGENSVLSDSIAKLALGLGQARPWSFPDDYLVLSTKHDRDLARSILASSVGKSIQACGFFENEPVRISYLPRGNDFKFGQRGWVNTAEQYLEYIYHGQQKRVPLHKLTYNAMISPALVMSQSANRRIFTNTMDLRLDINEFAHVQPSKELAVVFSGSSMRRVANLSKGLEQRAVPDRVPTVSSGDFANFDKLTRYLEL
jgi:conjugative relaxase-like TrwC/TraI family protein